MTNKERIIKKLSQIEYDLGCYDKDIEKLNYNNLKKVLKNIGYGSTDVQVFINRKSYIVEVSEVESEYDFKLLSKEEYRNLYGDQYDEDFGW